ncbi:MAG: hypothetical protein MRZ79_12830 [Bacteroidia bacterium]|nr:hypothetical protein [Bacteroidia bacterium]
MEILEEDIARIEAYLQEELSLEDAREQVVAFDAKLATYEQSRLAINAWSEQQLKEQLKKSYEPATVIPFWANRRFQLMAIAAGIALLLGIFLWPKGSSSSFSTEEYLAQNYKKPESPLSNVRGDNLLDSLRTLAHTYYESGRYEACISTVNELNKVSDIGDDNEVLALLGYTYMETKKWPLAETYLLQVSPSYPEYNKVQWNLVLVFLRLEELELAKETLVFLQAKSKEYKNKASDLLDELPKE